MPVHVKTRKGVGVLFCYVLYLSVRHSLLETEAPFSQLGWKPAPTSELRLQAFLGTLVFLCGAGILAFCCENHKDANYQ